MLKITILCLAIMSGTRAQVSPLLADGLRNPLPLTPSATAVTLHKVNENDGSGNFRYAFETSDGTRQEQTGILKDADPLNPEGSQAVQGSYSYISPEGVPVHVRYIADENGYRAYSNNDGPGVGAPFPSRAPFNPRVNPLNPFVDPALVRHPNNLGFNSGLRPDLLNRHPDLLNRHPDLLNRHPDLLNRHPDLLNRHPDVLTRELLLRQQQQPFNRFNQFNGRNPYNFNHPHQNRFFPGQGNFGNYNGLGGFGDRIFH